MTKILIAADYYPRRRVAEAIEKGHYETVFGKIKPIEADYKIVNFEGAVATEEDKSIKKSCPNLKCLLKLLKEKYLVYLGKSNEYYLSVLEPYNSRLCVLCLAEFCCLLVLKRKGNFRFGIYCLVNPIRKKCCLH